MSRWVRVSGDRRRRLAWATIAVVLVGLLAVRWQGSQPYSGDEPHYLLVSESLIHDGDVDVKNDYLARRYRSYYPGQLDPHVNTSMFTLASRHWYSMHGVILGRTLLSVWVDGARRDGGDGYHRGHRARPDVPVGAALQARPGSPR